MEWILAIAASALLLSLPQLLRKTTDRTQLLVSIGVLIAFVALATTQYDSESRYFLVILGVLFVWSAIKRYNKFRTSSRKNELHGHVDF